MERGSLFSRRADISKALFMKIMPRMENWCTKMVKGMWVV
jgi:hypothetical protein